MKKAFTLSEALITLAILGVLAAILIPVINNVRPDKDRVTYKKALYSVQGAVSSALESDLLVSGGEITNQWGSDPTAAPLQGLEADSFCLAVADALNTSGKINCNGPSSYQSPNFVTTDGIRFWGLEGTIQPGSNGKLGDKVIYVDRNLSSNELRNLASKRLRATGDEKGLKIRVRADGKVDVPSSEEASGYDFENELIENSLQVSAGKQ